MAAIKRQLAKKETSVSRSVELEGSAHARVMSEAVPEAARRAFLLVKSAGVARAKRAPRRHSLRAKMARPVLAIESVKRVIRNYHRASSAALANRVSGARGNGVAPRVARIFFLHVINMSLRRRVGVGIAPSRGVPADHRVMARGVLAACPRRRGMASTSSSSLIVHFWAYNLKFSLPSPL